MTLVIMALLLAALAAGFVVHPILVQRWGQLSDAVPASLQAREARKRIALAALKDVEYDRAAGKLDESDYLEIRGKLEVEALAALTTVDAEIPGTGAPHGCGFVNPSGSRYCSGCGQRLA